MTSSSGQLPSLLVGSEWLAGHLGDPDLRILDCTVLMKPTPDGGYTFVGGREEWERSHIPGAMFVDVLADLADRGNPLPMMMPAAADFAHVMSGLGVEDGTRVVVYDRSNHAWAARVWWMLRSFGFDSAAVLDGGWQKWIAEGRPVTSTPGRYAKGNFRPRHRPARVADRNEVAAAIGNQRVCLINALSPEEFRGGKTRFPRPGRIPGSRNVYCQSLVDPQTHAFLPVDELRRCFESTGAAGAERIVTYCGAGIAASSNAFVLTLLGMQDVAVYDGSLAEWTADPSLPMEVDPAAR